MIRSFFFWTGPSDYQKDKKKVYNQINTVIGNLKDSTDLSGEDTAKIVQRL